MRVKRSIVDKDPCEGVKESPERKHAQESQGVGQRDGPRRTAV